MKIRNKDLKKAYTLVMQKKYPRAIRFLEPKVPLFLEDELFYYLLGVSCFHTGDVGGSEFYFKRSLQVNHHNIESRLYLAGVQLKKKDQSNAARIWLNILDIDPGNKFAKKGLNKIKRIKNPSEFENFINSKDINTLFVPIRGVSPFIIRIMILLFIIPLISIGFYYLIPYIKPVKIEREHIAFVSLDNYTGSFVEFDGEFNYIMTGAEIKELFNAIVEDYYNFNDNLMQKKINKLNLSNAKNEIKGEIAILENLIQQPTYLTLKSNFDYLEIIQEPLLYNNCFVLWRGKVTNISINKSKITLDFLVGYENETYLEGIVYTEIPFEVSINQALPVEILGQVDSSDGRIKLSALSIRPLRD